MLRNFVLITVKRQLEDKILFPFGNLFLQGSRCSDNNMWVKVMMPIIGEIKMGELNLSSKLTHHIDDCDGILINITRDEIITYLLVNMMHHYLPQLLLIGCK